MFIQLKRSLNNHYVFLHEEYDIIGRKAFTFFMAFISSISCNQKNARKHKEESSYI